jgi:predicted amidophosphoribosyltransferase
MNQCPSTRLVATESRFHSIKTVRCEGCGEDFKPSEPFALRKRCADCWEVLEEWGDAVEDDPLQDAMRSDLQYHGVEPWVR